MPEVCSFNRHRRAPAVVPQYCMILAIVAGMGAACGAEPWNFDSPFGVAVDSRDVIHVAEIGHRRISRFTADGQWLAPITAVDGYGPLAGPFDVTIGPKDHIYITDTINHRVIVLDAEGRLQLVLGQDGKAADEGTFAEPHFVAVNNAGQIFVSDTFNARIQKFSPEGTLIGTWGRTGDGPGQFLHMGHLGGIACDNHGFIYLRETDGGRIQKYTEEGEHVVTIGLWGTTPGQLGKGYGTAVIADKLWVTDTFENRIQIFSLAGTLLDVWEPREIDGEEYLNHPVDIAATSKGHLIVTDWKNNRVLKLDPEGQVLEVWGRTIDDLLSYQPPSSVERDPHDEVKFSIYGGISEVTLEACRHAGIDRIYAPCDDKDGQWQIATAARQAAAKGLEVHPSIAMLTFGQVGMQFIREHPELCMWKKQAREPLKTILSWAQPEARRYRIDHLVAQVAASQVQGVMLDYIRYLGIDYGYDPIAIDGFFRRYGINPVTLPDNDPRWIQYRADFITDFVVALRRRLAALNREVHLSIFSTADGNPDTALHHSLQDWPAWAHMGIVDTVQTVQYTRDFELIYETVRQAREAVPARTNINCFIACYGGNLNTPDLLRKGYEVAIAAGADEVTLYRSDTLWELNLWDTVADFIAESRGNAETAE